MKKRFFVKIVLAVFVFVVFLFNINILYCSEKEPAEKEGWILVWEDEFEGNSIDRTKWRIEDAALVKNNEMQYYSPEEVFLKKGCLVLRSQKRKKENRNYTSGLIETKGKYTQTFGRFEMRAKFPFGQGIWPAFWLMNSMGKWPPEIDIGELLGHERNKVHMTNHYGSWPQNRMEGEHYEGPDFTESFHSFAIEWEPDEIRWFVDGVKRFFTRKNIPDIPFYIVINTAVGGDWPGFPDNTTKFPQYYTVDYVRVYKRDIKGTRVLTTSADNGRIIYDPEKVRYKKGSTVKLQAIPNIGYKFHCWGGDLKGKKRKVNIVMNNNNNIVAYFKKDPDAPKLLSKNKRVKASSEERSVLEAKNVVDGKKGTRWSSEFSDPQWIYVDLAKPCTVRAVRLIWESAHGKTYDIQVSLNNKDWKTVRSIKEDNIGGSRDIWLKPVKARYIRMYGIKRASRWGYSLLEFEVFGKE